MLSVLQRSETYATVVNFLCIKHGPHALRGASGGGWLSCHRMAHYVLIRCFWQLSLAEALCLCNFFSVRDRPHALRGASDGGYSITAWRTTCLYGVSDSWASPRLFDDGTSSVSETRPKVLTFLEDAIFLLTVLCIFKRKSRGCNW